VAAAGDARLAEGLEVGVGAARLDDVLVEAEDPPAADPFAEGRKVRGYPVPPPV